MRDLLVRSRSCWTPRRAWLGAIAESLVIAMGWASGRFIPCVDGALLAIKSLIMLRGRCAHLSGLLMQRQHCWPSSYPLTRSIRRPPQAPAH